MSPAPARNRRFDEVNPLWWSMINKSKKQLVKSCFCLFKIPPIRGVLVVLVIVVCKYAKKQLLRKSYFSISFKHSFY